MTTKDWLNRGWALDREITALESAKRRAYDRCVSGVASVSGAPGGGGASDGGLSRWMPRSTSSLTSSRRLRR